MGTPNKDAEGDFTDEAIKAVEDENERLAEIVGLDPMEFGELCADATHRIHYDTIEEELITMKLAAIHCLNAGFESLNDQFQRKHTSFELLSGASFICGGIAILTGIFGVISDNTAMIVLTPIFGFLMILLMLPCMVLTNIQEHILDTMKRKSGKAMKLLDECTELVNLLR